MQKQKRKTNHIHRAACALLAGLAFSLGLLTGCGSDGSTIVVGKKNEKGYSRAEVMVIAMTEKKRYEEVCTDQIWGVSVGEKGDDFETYLKKQIRSFMDELKIMNLLAADRGISLTSEERAAMDRAAAEYFGRLPQSAIDSMGVTEADVQHIYEDYGLAEKLAGRNWSLMVGLGILLLCSMAVAAFISHRYVRPVMAAFRQIKAGGQGAKTHIPEIDDLIEFLSTQDEAPDPLPGQSALYQEFVKNIDTLSAAERAVFDLYMRGHTAREIAEILCLSINTIKPHTRRIYMKLNVTSRKELMVYIQMMEEAKDAYVQGKI